MFVFLFFVLFSGVGGMRGGGGGVFTICNTQEVVVIQKKNKKAGPVARLFLMITHG